MRPSFPRGCRLIELHTVSDPRGTLVVIEDRKRRLPFRVGRVFVVLTSSQETVRGGHAHRTLREIIVCLKGSLKVELRRGKSRRVVLLRDPGVGLYIPPMVWATQTTKAADTMYLVVMSKRYNENDYLRDYASFQAALRVRHDH